MQGRKDAKVHKPKALFMANKFVARGDFFFICRFFCIFGLDFVVVIL